MMDKISKKQREVSSLELSFEKVEDQDVFKDSLKPEDCILILQIYMAKIEKKMEELCTVTTNTKECQIKGELQVKDMNETINFISKKFDEFGKK